MGADAPSKRRRLSSEQHEQVLLAAATRLFARQGLVHTTVTQIAAEARVSLSTFYAHFDDKEQCLLACVDRFAADLVGALAEPTELEEPPDPWERTGELIARTLDLLAADPDRARLVLPETIGGSIVAVARLDQLLAMLGAFIDGLNRENVAAGTATPFGADDLGLYAVGGLHLVISSAIRADRLEELRAPQRIEEFVVAMRAAVTARRELLARR